jgi:hypothetical protein
MQIKNYQNLLSKIEKVVAQKDLDLSSGEDLSIGIMNLISIEEHLFFTSQKTKDKKYLEILNEVRKVRTDLLKEIIHDYEGEVWCISKHLLAASMRIMEVGTKELKKGNKDKAQDLFKKSYDLYALFWALNLGSVKVKDIKKKDDTEIELIDEEEDKGVFTSVFEKASILINKALDCCRE